MQEIKTNMYIMLILHRVQSVFVNDFQFMLKQIRDMHTMDNTFILSHKPGHVSGTVCDNRGHLVPVLVIHPQRCQFWWRQFLEAVHYTLVQWILFRTQTNCEYICHTMDTLGVLGVLVVQINYKQNKFKPHYQHITMIMTRE